MYLFSLPYFFMVSTSSSFMVYVFLYGRYFPQFINPCVVLGLTAQCATGAYCPIAVFAVANCSRRDCRAYVYSRCLRVYFFYIWIMKLTLHLVCDTWFQLHLTALISFEVEFYVGKSMALLQFDVSPTQSPDAKTGDVKHVASEHQFWERRSKPKADWRPLDRLSNWTATQRLNWAGQLFRRFAYVAYKFQITSCFEVRTFLRTETIPC